MPLPFYPQTPGLLDMIGGYQDPTLQAPQQPPQQPGLSPMPPQAAPGPAPSPPGLLERLAGPTPSYGGLLDPAAQKSVNSQFLLNLGTGLLANSGSGQRFGAILGQSYLQAQQQKQQAIDEQLRNMLLTRGKPAEPYTLAPGQKRFDANNNPVAAVAEKPAGNLAEVTPKDFTPESLQKYSVTHNFGDLVPVDAKKSPGELGSVNPGDFTPASLAKYQASGNLGDLVRTYAPTAASQANAGVTDDAIKLAADTYRATGKFPTGLGRNPVLQGRVLNQVAKDLEASGDNVGALNARSGAIKATQGALDQNQKLQSATKSYYDTLDANLSKLQELSGKVDSSGSPIINKVLRAYQQNVSGDPEIAKYVTYLRSVETEFAKIQSGSLGNQGVSDAARRDAQDIINKNMNPAQIEASAEAIRTEGRNRLQAIEDQHQSLLGQLGQGAPGTQPPASVQPSNAAPPAAPPAAIDYLRKNPQFKEAFRAKYGYVP